MTRMDYIYVLLIISSRQLGRNSRSYLHLVVIPMKWSLIKKRQGQRQAKQCIGGSESAAYTVKTREEQCVLIKEVYEAHLFLSILIIHLHKYTFTVGLFTFDLW